MQWPDWEVFLCRQCEKRLKHCEALQRSGAVQCSAAHGAQMEVKVDSGWRNDGEESDVVAGH